jgi:hypothetical protein
MAASVSEVDRLDRADLCWREEPDGAASDGNLSEAFGMGHLDVEQPTPAKCFRSGRILRTRSNRRGSRDAAVTTATDGTLPSSALVL